MEKDSIRKICFDLEDRPPLSYWEERQLEDDSLQSSLVQQNKGDREQLRIKPEDWIKAPEFVPRSKQLLTQSFYVEPQYSLESSSKNYFDMPYSFSTSAYGDLNSASSHYTPPEASSAAPTNTSATTNGCHPMKPNGSPLNANDVDGEQKKSKEVAIEADLIPRKDRQSSESCDISSSEELISKNNNSNNLRSVNDDFALFTIGGSCPELFEIQGQRTLTTDGNVDLHELKNTDNKKNPSPSNPFVGAESAEKPKNTSISTQRSQRFTYRNRFYKPPNKTFIQMATFNPDYNTTSSSIVTKTNKNGFIQDCFEGLNVRFNNFDDCEEMTLSDTEDVSPPRLKQFPWVLDKNLRQYTNLNEPERVCCALM